MHTPLLLLASLCPPAQMLYVYMARLVILSVGSYLLAYAVLRLRVAMSVRHA